MKKIVSIVGARPQFIKAGAFSRSVLEDGGMQEVIVHTGQHYDTKMSESFFRELEIPTPAYHLGIGGLSHGAMTGRMLEKIEEVLCKEKPDFTLVYGDTDSTLAGALASVKLQIPIVHIEAGLRSFNMQMPEEINRILTDRISKILFVPSQKAYDNLVKEGFLGFDCKIIKSGDIMLDVALHYQKMAKKPNIALSNKFILCTLHRAENTDNPLRMQAIFQALNAISKEVLVVIPLHPRTKNILEKSFLKVDNICFVEPLSYLEMVWMLQNCQIVATDSGGLQKEAYFFKKPCMTLRDETEWTELVECGYNVLVGANKDKILNVFSKIADNRIKFDKNLYGNGDTSYKILQTLKEV
ncbi:UDP-N-acetylglucosamine 2-epimerase (non-hydrolyzing) [Helicobacter sp. MIT 11-5569]|uniref:non-hydrolyzing UDP-N-acetylglucosamine 2-epimerase n=1 Tax=Helicobacter sp. MIT 11-5569 TaxID=1548151 RepID=UPI00051FD477|nr:UDP-N-acetylglucosamine 2-epimerase (non-hydrolyzing) [Helicobacter sp. MIT 11-5569]TLD81366.1 UDP-N-acetylglucosamine 2-epimerase (non-hydrolyzing) [Helicobacter sp. MIT 11-5569]